MNAPELTSSLPSDVAAELFSEAAQQLNRSEKGAIALRSLAGISDDFVSLEPKNQQALMLLVRGIFTHPGTGREVLKTSAGLE
jgi:hypothetical protein